MEVEVPNKELTHLGWRDIVEEGGGGREGRG